jgi:hypothetical protein
MQTKAFFMHIDQQPAHDAGSFRDEGGFSRSLRPFR